MLRDPVASEELVQELFTRIWQKRESKGITENFSGYMFRIAQNLVHDFFRRLKKDLALQEKFKAEVIGTDAPSAEDILQRQQSLGLINNAIEHLPPQQKKAYKLVRQEGYSYKKAAEDMGISPLTVKEYLTLANKSIRSYLFSKIDSPSEIILTALISLSFL